MKELEEDNIDQVILDIGNKLTGQEIWYWESLVHLYREYKRRIDKANRVLGETLIKYEDGVFKPIKNTSKQDVYKAVCKLYGILGTTAREGYKDE